MNSPPSPLTTRSKIDDEERVWNHLLPNLPPPPLSTTTTSKMNIFSRTSPSTHPSTIKMNDGDGKRGQNETKSNGWIALSVKTEASGDRKAVEGNELN